MCSDRGLPASVCTVSLAVLLALGAATGCGRKEDPQPPPRKNPGRTTDLTVAQRGTDLYLTMTYPAVTVGGLALPGIDRVEWERFVRPAPEFMNLPAPGAEAAPGEAAEGTAGTEAPATEAPGTEAPGTEPPGTEPPDAEAEPSRGEEEDPGSRDAPPEAAEPAEPEPEETPGTGEEPPGETPPGQPSTEGEAPPDTEAPDTETPEAGTEAIAEANPYLQVRVDTEQFDKSAETVLVLEGADLDAAVVGGRIVVRLPLEEIPTAPPSAHAFRARTFAGRLASPDSNLAAFVALPPPPAPTDLVLEALPTGVMLSWRTAASEIEIEGFNVYRRLPQAATFPEPLASLGADETEYLDRSAQFGGSYVYMVTAVRMERPLVESSPASEQALDYRDAFAPVAPRRLVALAETARVRLVWEASPESDVVGYLVFVSRDGGAPEPLTPDPIPTSEYMHTATVPGSTYSYHVVAVDSAGNRSEASDSVATRAP